MPGMMDSILNLGLNDEAVAGLRAHDRERALRKRLVPAPDPDVRRGRRRDRRRTGSSRRSTDLKKARGVAQDVDLSADDLAGLIETYQRRSTAEETGRDFPQDAREQLTRAVRAVFDSWDTPRAQVYRRTYDIPDELGTAVERRADGLRQQGRRVRHRVSRFTRDPSTGEPGLYGEFLANAQGEDVVAGIRTPEPLARDGAEAARCVRPAARRRCAGSRSTTATCRTSSSRSRTTSSISCRRARPSARRPPRSRRPSTWSTKGLISREDAVARIDPAQLDQLLHPMIDPAAEWEVAAKGLNASPGAACGQDRPRRRHGRGARQGGRERHPRPLGDDAGRHPRPDPGGRDPHRARRHDLARSGRRARDGQAVRRRLRRTLDRPRRATRSRSASQTSSEGDLLTIDGGTGAVIVGEVPLVPPEVNDDLETILGWGDQHRRLKVRANADTPEDAAKAREFGAQGIGLCRTEHMFMAEDRLPVVREMILADGEDGPARSRSTGCCRCSRATSRRIFEAMAGLPVTIRLLDPPLHEFLPPPEQATDERMRAAHPGSCRSRTRCSARAAAVSACSGRRSTRCRCGRSSRAARAVRGADGRGAARRDHAPARRLRRRSCAGCASSPCALPRRRRRRSSTSAGR